MADLRLSLEMADKRVLLLVAIIIISLVLVLFLFASPAPEPAQEPKPEYLVMDESVIGGDPEGCDQIANESKRDLCKSLATDISIYNKALQESDVELCAGIKDETFRNACAEAITTSVVIK
jgi:hypothetical protein